MCLPTKPSAQLERREPPFVPEWQWEGQHHFGQNPNFIRQRNYMDHLLKIQFHSDYRPAPFERKMIALFASAFECSFLFAATISALFSIVQPKVKNGLLLLALPLCALIPAVAGGQEPAAGEKTGEDGN